VAVFISACHDPRVVELLFGRRAGLGRLSHRKNDLGFSWRLLGAVAVMLVLSMLPVSLPDILILIFILAGIGVVGFFGSRFGDWVLILATTLTGAYSVIMGLVVVLRCLGSGRRQHLGANPIHRLAILVFLILFATGALAQLEFAECVDGMSTCELAS